jgi:hypothetical protein
MVSALLEKETPVQALVLLVAVLTLGHCICWTVRHKQYWFFGIPSIAYLIHLLVFYGYLLYLDVTGDPYNAVFRNSDIVVMWSALLRLQGVLTMLFMLIIAGTCLKVQTWTQQKS